MMWKQVLCRIPNDLAVGHMKLVIDSMVLTSRRSTPGVGQAVQHGEGVALVLEGRHWQLGGQQWRACTSDV